MIKKDHTRQYDGDGEREQPAERQGLSLAAAGGVPRVPEEQVLPLGHRMQIRTSPCQR